MSEHVHEPRSLEVLTGARRAAARRSCTPRSARPSSERAGVINLGTEGSMLRGALAAYAVDRRDRQPVGRRRSPARSPAALLALVHALLRAALAAPTSWPPASSCCSSGSGSRRCSASTYVERRSSTPSRRGTSRCSRDIPCIGDDLLPATTRSSTCRTSLVPAAVVAAVPQPLGPAAAGRRRAQRGARDLRPPAARSCSTSPSSSAACSPASAAPSCRPPTPTPGSRT